MAARAWCQVCGLKRTFKDHEPITPYCSDECEREATGAPEDDGAHEADGASPDEVVLAKATRVRQLIALAMDPAAAPGESANATRAAFALITKHGLLPEARPVPRQPNRRRRRRSRWDEED